MVAKMLPRSWISACVLVLLLSLHPRVHAFYLPGTFMHTYSPGEVISAKVNSLTSIETELPFSYYSLPYCKPLDGVKKSAENLGEILMGDQIDNSPYRFQVNVNESVFLCTTDPLTKEQAELLKRRARDLYQVNMVLDNLPVMQFTEQNGVIIQWTGFPVGYNPIGSNEDYITNHLKFRVLVHQYQAQGDVVVTSEDGVAMVESDRKSGFQIVGFEVVPCSVRRDPESMSKLKMYDKVDSVNCPLELEKSQAIRENERITFTYEVEYVKSNIKWPSRWDAYLKMDGANVHWFSIMNSMMVCRSVTSRGHPWRRGIHRIRGGGPWHPPETTPLPPSWCLLHCLDLAPSSTSCETRSTTSTRASTTRRPSSYPLRWAPPRVERTLLQRYRFVPGGR